MSCIGEPFLEGVDIRFWLAINIVLLLAFISYKLYFISTNDAYINNI